MLSAVRRAVPRANALNASSSSRIQNYLFTRHFSSPATKDETKEEEDPAVVAAREEAQKQEELAIQARYTAENMSPGATPWYLPYKNEECLLPEDLKEVAALDIAHDSQQGRKVLITQHPQNAMTSCTHNSKAWYFQWTHEENWTNPLTGYTSGADPMACTLKQMKFDNPEQAVAFAKKRGWNYEVAAENHVREEYGQTSYEDNFLSKRVKAKIRAGGLKKCDWFNRPAAGTSHYVRPLNYHGTGRVPQYGPNGGDAIAPDAPSYYKQR